MERKDYYGILGVAKDADATEIRMAYRKMALQNHPDTNMDDPDAEDRFKEINEAYDVLSHREKRNQYDLGGNPQTRGFPLYRSPFGSWDDPFEAEFFPGMRCRGEGWAGFLHATGGFFGEAGSGRQVSLPMNPIVPSAISP